jgi:sphinganine-1-phosphate aldolase
LGFEVLGNPQLGLVAFSHPVEDIYAIYKQMYKRGWFTSLTTQPKALHLMLSPFHAQVTDTYLADLESSLKQVQAGDKDRVSGSRYS